MANYKELKNLVGDYVHVQFNTVLYERMPDLQAVGFSPIEQGYLVEVTENFIYIGSDKTTFDCLIKIDSITSIRIKEPPVDSDLLDLIPDGENSH